MQAFFISFRGSCQKSPKQREDGYRILVSEENNNNLKTISNHKKIYFDHNSDKKRRQGKQIERWDDGRFLIRSMYLNTKHKRGCSPVLKIQFMSAERHRNQNCYNAGK